MADNPVRAFLDTVLAAIDFEFARAKRRDLPPPGDAEAAGNRRRQFMDALAQQCDDAFKAVVQLDVAVADAQQIIDRVSAAVRDDLSWWEQHDFAREQSRAIRAILGRLEDNSNDALRRYQEAWEEQVKNTWERVSIPILADAEYSLRRNVCENLDHDLKTLRAWALAIDAKAEQQCQLGKKKDPQATEKPKRTKGQYNRLMLEQMLANPESMGWLSPEWSRFLHCPRNTVTKQPAWQNTENYRLTLKAEHRRDRRRRPRHQSRK